MLSAEMFSNLISTRKPVSTHIAEKTLSVGPIWRTSIATRDITGRSVRLSAVFEGMLQMSFAFFFAHVKQAAITLRLTVNPLSTQNTPAFAHAAKVWFAPR
jgi:hypothetical protein